jgi:hypothetical protein
VQRSKDPKKTTLWVENKPMAVSFFAQSRGQYRRDIFDRTIVDEVSGRVRCAVKFWSLMGQVDFQAYIPAQKHVTKCSSVLNIANFVCPCGANVGPMVSVAAMAMMFCQDRDCGPSFPTCKVRKRRLRMEISSGCKTTVARGAWRAVWDL